MVNDTNSRILVIGDSCEDVYIYGKCDRLCPDAPVPVLIPTKTVTNGGMAKNVFENVKSIFPKVDLLTDNHIIIKTRYVHEKTNQMFIRVDSEQQDTTPINVSTIEFEKYSAIIISDYCKGFLLEKDINYICNSHPNVFIDTKKLLGKYCINAKIIKINEAEYNHNLRSNVDLAALEDRLIITMGENGCRFKDTRFPVEKVEIKDMTGAGDTFIACLVVKYLETQNMKQAIAYANLCASIIVQHKGVNKIGDFL